MATYIGLLRKESGSDFGVSFPDFPGCVTAGATLEEARELAAEALALHIEGMIADNEPVPVPTPLDEVMAEESNRDGVAVLVDIAAPQPKVVRINVTFKEDLLEQIDAYSESTHTTRASFLEQAAKEKLAMEKPRYPITVVHNGDTINGSYEIDGSIVTAYYAGRHMSTQVGGSPAKIVARWLLREMVEADTAADAQM